MSQAPSMPLYTDALIGDTLHLSTEEFGAYCLLLFATWRNNGEALKDSDRDLARICRVSVPRWRQSLRPKLIHFFSTGDGKWHQKRLEKEWQFVQKKVAALRKNGVAGGRATALKRKETVAANARPNGPAGPPPPTPIVKKEPSPYEEGSSLLARDASPPLPSQGDGVAALRATQEAEQADPTVFDDPALKAYGLAALSRCLDAVHGRLAVLDADATEPPPPDPRLIEFRGRLQRLNAIAGEQLTGALRDQAWTVLATAAELSDPLALPDQTAADLDAIEKLEPRCAEAAE